MSVEVVGKRDPMTSRDLVDLMLAIAVEGGPLNIILISPVISHLLTTVGNAKLAATMTIRKAHDESAELCNSARGIDVRLELSRRSRVDLLYHGSVKVSV